MSTESSEANAYVEDAFPMMLIGRDHRVSYANLRAHQLFGYERGGLHGLSIERLLAPTRRSEVRNVQAVLAGKAPRRWKSLMREGQGGTIEVNVGVEPCHDHRGQVIAVKVHCERVLRSGGARESEPSDWGSGAHRIGSPRAAGSVGAAPLPTDRVRPSTPMGPVGSARTGGRSTQPVPNASVKKSHSTVGKPAPAPSSNPPLPATSVRPPLPATSVRPPLPATSVRPPLPAPSSNPPISATSAKPPPPVESVRPPPPVESVRPPPPVASTMQSSALNTRLPVGPVASVRPAPVNTVRSVAPLSRSTAPKPQLESSPAILAPNPTVRTSQRPATELVLQAEAVEQLETALQLLGWLRQRVDSVGDSLDQPRERARMQYILTETTELIAQVRCDARRR